MNIYVFPTEEGKPPRALLYEGTIVMADDEGTTVEAAVGTVATWSRDGGAWMLPNEVPVPEDVGEAITDHAKSLGVEW